MMKTVVLRACAASLLLIGGCESDGLSGADYETGDIVMSDSERLATIIAERGDEDKARDRWRHPMETIEFFGVASDDFVVEALPGRGWYTRILAPYVAGNGRYAAVTYPYEMYPLILPDPNEELLARLKAWPETFPGEVAKIAPAAAPAAAFEFGNVPEDLLGQVDALLIIRAMHNFNRAGGDYRDVAIADAYAMLKPGGVLGIVQHRAAEDAEGPAGDGSNGYLKQSDVIAMFEEAGFVFEEASEINANPADRPGPGEIVWRLPPTYGLGEETRDQYAAIGESDRMTLRFRKPAE